VLDRQPVRRRGVSATDHATGLATECNAPQVACLITRLTPMAPQGREGQMPGAGQDLHTLELALVLATIIVVFRRAIVRAMIAILAVIAVVLLGAGAVTLFAHL
jgi:hypothetical protein